MSSPPLRAPQTDAEWARNTERRLRLLESPRSAIRVGAWTITVSGGELVATAPGRGEVNLTSPLGVGAAGSVLDGGLHREYLVTMGGAPDGGTFTLRFKNEHTEALDFDTDDDAIKAALVALNPKYTSVDFTVTEEESGGPWTVLVPNVGALSLGYVNLTGGTDPYVTVELVADIVEEEL